MFVHVVGGVYSTMAFFLIIPNNWCFLNWSVFHTILGAGGGIKIKASTHTE